MVHAWEIMVPSYILLRDWAEVSRSTKVVWVYKP
jgi:hypothetical protein